jgi:predicted acyltransferase
MTLVDVVFPAFLFIVGLAIPFAIARREAQFPEKSVLLHIVIRTAGLLAIGLLMLNGPAVTSMNKAWWNVLMYTGAILFWSAPPRTKKYISLHRILKGLGFVLLLILLIIFRREAGDTTSWIRTGWWGILGEIGFAYLIASLLWLYLRKKPYLLFFAPVVLLLLYIADRSGQLDFLGKIKDIFYIGSHLGIHPLIAVCGLICGRWIFENQEPSKLMKHMGIFAVILTLSGYLLYGLYGIDKVAATPSWALYSSAICVLLFMLIYWIMDVKNKASAYGFFKPVAANPLLAYLLHVQFIYFFQIIGIAGFYGSEPGAGIIGILRAIVYTGFIYILTRLLSRAGIRLKL